MKVTWSILQYFWPALSNNSSWKPIFGIFKSGCFTQDILYLSLLHSNKLTLGFKKPKAGSCSKLKKLITWHTDPYYSGWIFEPEK